MSANRAFYSCMLPLETLVLGCDNLSVAGGLDFAISDYDIKCGMTGVLYPACRLVWMETSRGGSPRLSEALHGGEACPSCDLPLPSCYSGCTWKKHQHALDIQQPLPFSTAPIFALSLSLRRYDECHVDDGGGQGRSDISNSLSNRADNYPDYRKRTGADSRNFYSRRKRRYDG